MFTVCERKRKSNDIKKLKNTENHKQFCCGGGWVVTRKIDEKSFSGKSWVRHVIVRSVVTGNCRVIASSSPGSGFTSIFHRHMKRGKLNLKQEFHAPAHTRWKTIRKTFSRELIKPWRTFLTPFTINPHQPLLPTTFSCMLFHPQTRKNSSWWKLRNQFC